jgi:Cdc6-like AAA superfamily ATPase
MRHLLYKFDRVFGGDSNNDEVTGHVVRPLVSHAVQGGDSTILCYGQTGTGKTYTLMASLKCVADYIEQQVRSL